jgi:hypothetical protein
MTRERDQASCAGIDCFAWLEEYVTSQLGSHHYHAFRKRSSV